MSNSGTPSRQYKQSVLNPTRFEVAHMAAHEFCVPMFIRSYDFVAWRVREATEEEIKTLPRITKTALSKVKETELATPALLMAGGRPVGVLEENK